MGKWLAKARKESDRVKLKLSTSSNRHCLHSSSKLLRVVASLCESNYF